MLLAACASSEINLIEVSQPSFLEKAIFKLEKSLYNPKGSESKGFDLIDYLSKGISKRDENRIDNIAKAIFEEGSLSFHMGTLLEVAFNPDTFSLDASKNEQMNRCAISEVLEVRQGICWSLSLIVVFTLRRLGIDCDVVKIGPHVFVRAHFDGKTTNIESAYRGGTFPDDDDYYKDEFITKYVKRDRTRTLSFQILSDNMILSRHEYILSFIASNRKRHEEAMRLIVSSFNRWKNDRSFCALVLKLLYFRRYADVEKIVDEKENGFKKSANYWHVVGYAYALLKRKTDAIYSLKMAIELTTRTRKHAELLLAFVYFTNGNVDDALIHGERAIDAGFEGNAIVSLVAYAYAKKGNFKMANRYLSKLKGHISKIVVINRVVVAYALIGNIDKAQEICRIAVARFPQKADLWVLFAKMYLSFGMDESARRIIREGIKLCEAKELKKMLSELEDN
jgi:tetratricopeptide (TPR) repeat protein